MGLILPPTRPTQFVGANVNNPIARGLAGFYCWAPSAAFRNSVNGKIGTKNSNQTLLATKEGRVLQYNGSAQVQYTNFSNPNGVAANAVTVIARLKLVTKPGALNGIAAAYTNGNSRGGALAGFNSSGNAIGGEQTSSGLVVANDSTDWTGKWVTVGGSNGAIDGSGVLYVNGIFKGSAASGSTVGAGAPTGLWLGRDASSYFGTFTGQIAWVAIFNRLLSAAEHLAVARNPYGLLRLSPDRRVYYSPGGGNVNVNLTAATSSGAVGGFIPSLQITLSGAAATAGAAGVKPNPQYGLTAATTNGAVAGFTPQIQKTLAATATTATAEQFTPSQGSNVNLTGAVATGAVEPFGSSESVNLSAATSTGAAGSFVKTASINLAAASSTAGAGSFVGSIGVLFSGVATTTAVGNFSFNGAVNVSLNPASTTAGENSFGISRGGSFTLVGAATVGAAGQFTFGVSPALTAAAATGNSGVFAAQIQKALAGVATTSAAGPFAFGQVVTVNLPPAVAIAGTSSFIFGKVVDLTGVQAIAGYENFTVSIQNQPPCYVVGFGVINNPLVLLETSIGIPVVVLSELCSC